MPFVVTSIGTVNSTSGATAVVTVGAGGVPAGCIVVVAVTDNSNAAPGGSMADTGGNSYSAIHGASQNATQANGFGRLWHSLALVTALVNTNTITYTKAISGSNATLSAAYITGANPIGVDAAVSATATGSSTTPSVTSGTPIRAGELFIGWASNGTSSVAITQDAGNGGWVSPPDSTSSRLIGANQTNAAATTRTYAPTYAMTSPWSAGIVSYNPPRAPLVFSNRKIFTGRNFR